jgi:hypothetical protein
MRYTAMALLAASLPAQNLSVTATDDGAVDLLPRIAHIDQRYLAVPLPETAITVVEVGDGTGWWWSYIVPPLILWRDGCIERVSLQWPAEFRLPLAVIPPGTWLLRVGTAYGYSDTLTLRTY